MSQKKEEDEVETQEQRKKMLYLANVMQYEDDYDDLGGAKK